MMYRNQYQDHLKTCGYCRNQKENDHKAKGWFGNDTMIGGAVGGSTFGFILRLKKA